MFMILFLRFLTAEPDKVILITLKLLYVKLALFRPLTLIVLLSSGTISANYHPLPVFQLLLPSATLLLSTCFTFCKITLTYSIPVPGQLYDPAPAIPSFLASFVCLCFNYYLYHGRCLAWVFASRSHLPF